MPATRQFTFHALFILVFAATGCGGDDAMDGDTSRPLFGPDDKCGMIVIAHCARIAECAESIVNFFSGPADEQAFVNNCERSESDLCSGVHEVKQNIDACLADFPITDCGIQPDKERGFYPVIYVPDSCEGVLE